MRPCIRIAALLCAGRLAALAQSADLGVVKVGPALAPAGANVTYALTVFSAGPDAAASVLLTDPLPSGMTFVSVFQTSGPAFSCVTPAVGTNGTVTCTIGALSSGATADFSLTMKIDPSATGGTAFTNIATISSATFDPNDENDAGVAATLVPTPLADVGIQKTGPTAAVAGGNVAYQLTVINAGPDTALNVSLNDPLPGSMTFVSLTSPAGYACVTPAVGANGTVTCTIASLTQGNQGTFTLVGKVPPGTPSGTVFENVATVTTTTIDPSSENDVATIDTVVSAADVSITMTGPSSAVAGGNGSYTITVASAGPDAALTVGFGDALPAGMTFVSLVQNTGPTFNCSTPPPGTNGTVGCTDPVPLASGASAQFTLVAAYGASLAGTTVSNTATVSTLSADTVPGNNSATASVTLPAASDLSVTVTAGGPGIPGTIITYTITVTNNGPSTANNVTVTQPVPAGTGFSSLTQSGTPAFTCSSPGVNASGTVTCTAAAMNSGASVTFTMTVVVGLGLAPGSSITNTATVASTTTDPVPANNTASAQVTVGVATAASGAPALSGWALALLAAAMLTLGLWLGRPAQAAATTPGRRFR